MPLRARGRQRHRPPRAESGAEGSRFARKGAITDNGAMRISTMRQFAAAVAVIAAALMAAIPSARADDALPAATAAPAATVASGMASVASDAWETAQGLTGRALDLLGIRYKWGGTTPQSGLDCSGLVQFVFQEVTGVTLPRSAKELSPDRRQGGTRRSQAGRPRVLQHAALRLLARRHLSRRQSVHPCAEARPRGRGRDDRRRLSGHKHFDGARRLMGVLPGMIPSLVGAAASAAPLSAILRLRGRRRVTPFAQTARAVESFNRARPRVAGGPPAPCRCRAWPRSSALAPFSLRRFTSAPRAISSSARRHRPSRTAIISAVVPFGETALMSAPSRQQVADDLVVAAGRRVDQRGPARLRRRRRPHCAAS